MDEIDRKIIRALSEDARMSVVQIADRVGLSATPCKRRLKHLQDSGLIAGYTLRIDRMTAGFGITAYVNVELERQDADAISNFQKEVARFDEVVTGTLMTGAMDFQLEIWVESLEEFESFLQSKLMRLPGIRAIRSRFALKKFVERVRIP
ncbi:Lrp/AsnC family transcriptional regulator [Rhodobacteraceae bacterium R_SAG9]|nr:Lrp/AsnC family transcriptional regulator [Rhodobacteraceae bacterium R_SAG9]